MAAALASESGPFTQLLGADDGPRVTMIAKEDGGAWPFSIEDGFLACAYAESKPVIYFIEATQSENMLDEPARFVVMQDHRRDSRALESSLELLTPSASSAALDEIRALGIRLCGFPPNSLVGPDGAPIPAVGL